MSVSRRGILGGTAAVVGMGLTSRHAAAQQPKTMVLAASGTPEGFDGDVLRPGTQQTVVQVYEGLTRYGRVEKDGHIELDPTKIEPHLAEKWETSADGKRWVFTLRSGVKSPYGNELSAADVEWGWTKSFAQKRTGNFIANVANVTGVKALSQLEVEFTLSAPSSIFLACLTLYTPSIYDSTEAKKHATADDPWALDWMLTHTAGYGAYHCESVRPGEQANFVANPNYFRGPPFYARVIYRAVPSPASRITLLRSGVAQWIDRPNMQQIIDLRSDKRVKVEGRPGRAMMSVRMNSTIKPFDDVRVRQAFNCGIEQGKLVQSILLGTGDDAKSVLPPIVADYDPSFFEYGFDPAKGKALLAEAGYPNGLSTELIFSDVSWWEEQVAVQVADQLKSIGVTVTPRHITATEMNARGAPARQDMPFFTYEDGPIVLDPIYTLALLADSKGVSNRCQYANPKLDALVLQGRTTLDAAVKHDAVEQAQKIWMDDAPWILTCYPQLFEAMGPGISGWVAYPDERVRWVDLRSA